ncbi:MAG TPA: HD domain-containing protein [Patescibacteria group bacterium]|nr:HD domain-containing protein [Patescibacteria group bacterium]
MARQTTDLTREELERDEDHRLAPYAMRSARARRALPLERDGRIFDYRTEFQRDRDRVLHSRAFRRLRLKSHGGAFPPAERYRDRLTHSLEVSQLSRTAARGLGLNEDLVEAIALGHELGMPPFARAGEAALSALLGGGAGGSRHGFRYNEQSLRVVDLIEKRYEHAGVNLTDPTREGILKHAPEAPARSRPDGPAGEGLHLGWAPFFEAQLVGVIDEVASVVQDLDDALRAGDLEIAEVESLPIVAELHRRIRPRRGGLFMRANVINRGLTHMLVTSVIHHSRRSLRAWAKASGVETHEAFIAARGAVRPGTIGLTPAVRRLYDGLRSFLTRHLYQGAWLSGVAARARHLLGGLFRALTDDPRLADDYLLLRFKEEHGGRYLRDLPPAEIGAEMRRRYRGNARYARLVADHIAGMTDLFAVSEYERLLGPFVMGGTRR